MAYPRRQLFKALLGYRGNNPRRMGGASQAGPPQEQKRLKPPPAVQEEWRLMPTINYGLRGGGGSRPHPSKGCRGGSSCSHPTKGSRGGTVHVPAHLRAAGRAAHAPAKQMQPAGQPLPLGGQGVAGSGAARAPASGTGWGGLGGAAHAPASNLGCHIT
jgi:hypothetical protein